MPPLPSLWISEPAPEPPYLAAKFCWRSWRQPLLLALFGHAVLLWLLTQQVWQRPDISTKADNAIETYFYQAPPRVVEEPETQTPRAEFAELPDEVAERTEQQPTEVEAESAAVEPTEKGDTAATVDRPVAEDVPTVPNRQRASSLMERALQQVQASQDPALQHRAEQQRRQAEPKITVAPRFQELPQDPARQVVAQLGDGLQIIRTRDGCRIADPSKGGFEALMAARKVACGDEDRTDAGQQLQEILQRRSRRLQP